MPVCKVCFNEIEDFSFHELLHEKPSLCHKCFMNFNILNKTTKIEGIDCLILYQYNDFFKDLLYKFKGCYDIELANVFLEYFLEQIRFNFSNFLIIPAPSTKEANEERGFNHVVELIKNTKMKILPIIHKKTDFKQSDLSYKERLKVSDKLYIDGDVSLKGKKILIVDDVLTTGSTIKAMIKLIKTKNPKDIKILIMSKVKEK